MRRRTKLLRGTLVLCLWAGAREARADRRPYVWTYGYSTVPAASTELEYYQTWLTARLPQAATTTAIEHQVELETGLTDHFDVGLYQVFDQPARGGSGDTHLEYAGFKARGRYRFFERGVFWVDPLLYLEYAQAANLRDNGWEGKVVLARDVGPLDFACNLVEEGELQEDTGKRDWRKRLLLAASVEPSPAYKVGAELETGDEGNAAGPTLSYAWGDRWATLGAAWGWAQAVDFRVRLLIGIGL